MINLKPMFFRICENEIMVESVTCSTSSSPYKKIKLKNTNVKKKDLAKYKNATIGFYPPLDVKELKNIDSWNVIVDKPERSYQRSYQVNDENDTCFNLCKKFAKKWCEKHIEIGKQLKCISADSYDSCILVNCHVDVIEGTFPLIAYNSTIGKIQNNRRTRYLENTHIDICNDVYIETLCDSSIDVLENSYLNKMSKESCIKMVTSSSITSMRDNSIIDEVRYSKIDGLYEQSRIIEVSIDSKINALCDFATIDNLNSNARLELLQYHSHIHKVYGYATIGEVSHDATIGTLSERAMINTMRGKSSIKTMADESIIREMTEHSKVNCMMGSSIIVTMDDKSKIDEIKDLACVLNVTTKTAKIENLSDRSLVRYNSKLKSNISLPASNKITVNS